ncbi:MAG: hypothetical protein P1U56_19065 [Saprospiraceae bacterium]|nr:hypothetical protein [Saprospiraceae bacterium]
MNTINRSNKKEELDHSQSLLQQAFHLAKIPMVISFIVTPVRFLLELAGLPDAAIFLIGLLWLTIAFSVYWGIKLYRDKKAYLLLLVSLILFSPVSRLTVAIAWWVDTKWEIGTHYGLYFETWTQTLLNHVIYGSLVQIIPGIVLGSLTIKIMRYRQSVMEQ